MAEYIEREALLKELKEKHDDMMQDEEYYGKKRLWHEALSHARVESIVECQPTADVVEVRHGGWDDCLCSVCGEVNPTLYLDEWTMKYRSKEMPYCPNCGAKMDGKGEGE